MENNTPIENVVNSSNGHIADSDTVVREMLYWEFVKIDEEGNAILKVFNKDKQEEFAKQAKDSQKKHKQAEERKLKKATEQATDNFLELLDNLMGTDAVYVVPNRRVGNNLRIDYNRMSKEKTVTKNKDGATTRTVKTETVTLKHIVEDGVL